MEYLIVRRTWMRMGCVAVSVLIVGLCLLAVAGCDADSCMERYDRESTRCYFQMTTMDDYGKCMSDTQERFMRCEKCPTTP